MNPIAVLFDEHTVITAAIEAARALSRAPAGAAATERLRALLGFFREYADRFHHQKEEQVLFPEMARRDVQLEGGVLQEMLDQHGEFRVALASIEQDADRGDWAAACERLSRYCDALLDHIAVENDELFSMAEDLFSKEELRTLYFRFVDLDRGLGEDRKAALERAFQGDGGA